MFAWQDRFWLLAHACTGASVCVCAVARRVVLAPVSATANSQAACLCLNVSKDILQAMLLSMWVRCFRAGNGLAGIVRRLCVKTFLLLTRAMADHRSAGLTRRIRALQQRKRRCEATSALLPSESKLALLVYVLGGKSRPMLVHFLRGIGRRWQRRLQRTDIVMEQLLEDVVWAYRSDPPPETVLSLSKDQFAAGKYVVEYKLFHWVLTQNRCHGLRPFKCQQRCAFAALQALWRQAPSAAQMAGQIPETMGCPAGRVEGAGLRACGGEAGEGWGLQVCPICLAPCRCPRQKPLNFVKFVGWRRELWVPKTRPSGGLEKRSS